MPKYTVELRESGPECLGKGWSMVGPYVFVKHTSRKVVYAAPMSRDGNPWARLLCGYVADHVADGDMVVPHKDIPLVAFLETLMRADMILWKESLCREWTDFPVPAGYEKIFAAHRMVATCLAGAYTDRRNPEFWGECFKVIPRLGNKDALPRGTFTKGLPTSFLWDSNEYNPLRVFPKCVLFDTGGWNLKTSGSLSNMQYDCTAAAYCLGAQQAGIPIDLTFFAVENTFTDYPGTRYNNYWVTDTDAEGRVILADTMRWKEESGVTVGTLSGASQYIGTTNALFVHRNVEIYDIPWCSDYCVNLPILLGSSAGTRGIDGLPRNFRGSNGDAQYAVSFMADVVGFEQLEAHIDLSAMAFPAHDEYTDQYHYDVDGFLGLCHILTKMGE